MVEDAKFASGDELAFALEYLASCPAVEEYAAFYLDAFTDLRSERMIGMGGFGPIPVTRILEYGQHFSLSPHEMQTLKTVVQVVDAHDREKTAQRAARAKN